MTKYFLTILILLIGLNLKAEIISKSEEYNYLNDISLTLETDFGSGSGTIFKQGTNFYVLSAAHVIELNILTKGQIWATKQLIQNNEPIGEIRYILEILNYSLEEDIVVLKFKGSNLFTNVARFYDKDIKIGDELSNVASSYGKTYINAFKKGYLSQKNILIENKYYDLADISVAPGSSGSGLFIDNKFIGIITKARDNNMALFISLKRIKSWTEKEKIDWIFK